MKKNINLNKKTFLENVYASRHRPEFIHPDPLEFLYHYNDAEDREVVALIASSLAYGRVAQILKSVQVVLDHLGGRPAAFLAVGSEAKIEKTLKGFRHRFTSDEDMARLLVGAKRMIIKYGSLKNCFISGVGEKDENIMPALAKFVENLDPESRLKGLLPKPSMMSACKRLNLFLRWMVRSDEIDPGGWEGVPRSLLIIPLDTHMYKIGRALGFTKRGTPDLKAAIEITNAFSFFCPEDPVKYDFALTRLGIRDGIDVESYIKQNLRPKPGINALPSKIKLVKRSASKAAMVGH